MNQNEHSTIDPRDIQRYLAKLGFNPGPIDGVIGKLTMTQIAFTLMRRKIVVTGWSDDRKLAAVEQIMLSESGFYFDKIDGIVGPKTLAAYEDWEMNGPSEPVSEPRVVGGINRTYFFDRIRHSLFGGRMTNSQVDGITRILDYRESAWPAMPDAELAYLLATVKHETGHEMVPVKERGGEKYLRSKPYYPWYGRGLAQITWDYNYEKFGVKNFDDALDWPAALDIIFRGMIFGMFTGKSLADFIKPGKTPDFYHARQIINGTDKAKLIAGYADAFLDELTQARDYLAPNPPLAA